MSQNSTARTKLPPLRRPLVGHAAVICESLMLRRAMTVAQIQALHLPCKYTVEEIGQEQFQKHLHSQLETTRQIMEKLVAHQYVQSIRVGSVLLYGAVRERAVRDVAAYYQRQLSKQYGAEIPEELRWKMDADALIQRMGWNPYDKIMQWKDDSNRKHHIKDITANVLYNLAGEISGVECEEWLPEQQVRRRHQELRVEYTGPDGKPYESQLVPDDWYVFRRQVGQMVRREKLFLEVDNGTQTEQNLTSTNSNKLRRSWAHKFRAFHAFFKHKHFKRLYGYDNAKVLILTSSEGRMWNLKQVCEESGGRGRYWFTHAHLFVPANIFEKPIYVRAGDSRGTYVRLFAQDDKGRDYIE